jgi:carboxylesterase
MMKQMVRSLDPVRRCALPIEKVHDRRPKEVVLGIHGFGGYPGELALPARHLYDAGFDVYVPRLPGHGTSQRDFSSTNRFDWIGSAADLFGNLARDYDHVYLIGHSMGGAIACLLAASFPVSRMVLLAPAIKFSSPYTRLVPLLKWVRPRIPVPWEQDTSITFFDERDEDDDLFLGREYWSILNVRKISELLKISRYSVRILDRISAEVLLVTGGNDPTVPRSIESLVKERVHTRVTCMHLPDAGHLLPYDPDTASRTRLMDEIVAFLKV